MASSDDWAEDVMVDPEDSFDLPATPAASKSAKKTVNHGGPVKPKSSFESIHRWGVTDYGPNFDVESAKKLADSGVAPLVALTRGYRYVQAEKNEIRALRSELGLKGNTRQGQEFSRQFNGRGVMLMPWYTQDTVVAANQARTFAPPVTTWQYRPVEPAKDDDGRERKYEFVAGQPTIIGTHPCMPLSWAQPDQAKAAMHPVLAAEGMLKADSALTGMLIDGGTAIEDLSVLDERGNLLAAQTLRERLHDLLLDLPETHRVYIIQMAGVGNWRNNPEWASFAKGRTWWIGVDGDVSSNPNVWKQIKDLWDYLENNKKGTVSLLSPVASSGPAGLKKIGIDDYLAQVGTWRDLLGFLTDKLPKKPEEDSTEPGTWRVDPETGAKCQEAMPILDNNGLRIGVRWQDCYPIGGRVLSTTVRRDATRREVLDGVMSNTEFDRSAEDGCVLELKWIDSTTGTIKSQIIQGPTTLLSTPPDQWYRFGRARIHPDVLRLPEWPPTGLNANKWRSAIKAHLFDDQERVVAWRHMGWVPAASDAPENIVPAFIVGSQIYADPAVDTNSIQVDEALKSELSGADKFGIGDGDEGVITTQWDDPEFQEVARDALRDTLQAYVLNEAWTDPGIAALTLACALRPVCPIRSKSTIYLVGPPSSGKTFTAAKMMAFWSRRPGDWGNNSLPGTASTTYYATEFALASSVIWVADDLAPSVNRSKADAEEGNMEQLIRAVFNGQGKPRGNREGGMQRILNPIAPLVVTGENMPTVQSIRSRAIIVNIKKGALSKSFDPTDALDVLCDKEGVPAYVTEAMVLYVRHLAHKQGWKALIDRLSTWMRESEVTAKGFFEAQGITKSKTKRPAELASDMLISLEILERMARDLGLEQKYLDLFSKAPNQTSSLPRALMRLCMDSYSMVAEITPGRALLSALRSALQSKYCHVADAITPGSPPSAVAQYPNLASNLGWVQSGDNQSGRGEQIGTVMTIKGETLVLFDRHTAFNVAQRHFPELIPSGQKATSSWESVWDEGLASANFTRQPRSVTTRITAIADRPSGIPVPLDSLFGVISVESADPHADDETEAGDTK